MRITVRGPNGRVFGRWPTRAEAAAGRINAARAGFRACAGWDMTASVSKPSRCSRRRTRTTVRQAEKLHYLTQYDHAIGKDGSNGTAGRVRRSTNQEGIGVSTEEGYRIRLHIVIETSPERLAGAQPDPAFTRRYRGGVTFETYWQRVQGSSGRSTASAGRPAGRARGRPAPGRVHLAHPDARVGGPRWLDERSARCARDESRSRVRSR